MCVCVYIYVQIARREGPEFNTQKLKQLYHTKTYFHRAQDKAGNPSRYSINNLCNRTAKLYISVYSDLAVTIKVLYKYSLFCQCLFLNYKPVSVWLMCQEANGAKCKFCICFRCISCVQTELNTGNCFCGEPEKGTKCMHTSYLRLQGRSPGWALSFSAWELPVCIFQAPISLLQSSSAAWLRTRVGSAWRANRNILNTEELEITKHLQRKNKNM